MTAVWWWLIGGRYSARGGRIGVRLWWLGRWQPLRVVKTIGPLHMTEEVREALQRGDWTP